MASYPLTILLAPALVAAPLLLACDPASPELEIRPISIDSVEVTVLESAPVQVQAHVQGTIGDGCTKLHSVDQERSGNTITVTILSERPRDAVCTQIAMLYDETIRLDGDFPPGSYQLHVNAFDTRFRVD